jgi:hypothetical protein
MESLALPLQILAGIALAACAGLRAFVPLFVAGLAARFEVAQFVLGDHFLPNSGFAWIGSTPALIVFGTAVVVELLADKIPVVDHLLDLIQTFVRPLAGLLVMAVSLESLSPMSAAIVGLLVGSPIAAGVHAAKAKIRLASTISTAGLASPFLSVFEDLLALVGSVLAVVATLVAVLLIVFGVALTWRLFKGFRRRVVAIEQEYTQRP